MGKIDRYEYGLRGHAIRLSGFPWELEECKDLPAAIVRLHERAFAEQDWYGYIFSFPRPMRLRSFIDILGQLSDENYWKLLSEIWIDAEGPYCNRRLWLKLFRFAQKSARMSYG